MSHSSFLMHFTFMCQSFGDGNMRVNNRRMRVENPLMLRPRLELLVHQSWCLSGFQKSNFTWEQTEGQCTSWYFPYLVMILICEWVGCCCQRTKVLALNDENPLVSSLCWVSLSDLFGVACCHSWHCCEDWDLICWGQKTELLLSQREEGLSPGYDYCAT